MNNKFVERSGYLPAILWEKVFSLRLAAPLAILLAAASVISLAVSVFFASNRLLGLAALLLAGFFVLGVYCLYSYSMRAGGGRMTFFSAWLLEKAGAWDRFFPKIFFDELLKTPRFEWFLRRLDVPKKRFAEAVAAGYHDETGLPLDDIVNRARQKAAGANHQRIRYSDLLAALFELDETFQKIMFDFKVEEKDIREVAYWQRRHEAEREKRSRFWSRENLLNVKGIGKGWSGGFTVNLDNLAADITESVSINPPPAHLYGRAGQIELLSRMLLAAETGGNVVLVGQPGVGRHTLVRSLAHAMNTGRVFGPLRYKRLLEIDPGAIVSGAQSLNDVVARVRMLFGEAYRARDVVLVINDFDAFLDSSQEAGRVNATETILPFLKSRLQIIGITTPGGYENTIGRNPQLARMMGRMEIAETSAAETLMILQDTVNDTERRTGEFFTNRALKEIVDLSSKLIQNLPNPEKSVEVLEEAAVFVATNTGERIVRPGHVQQVMETRTKVPIREVAGREKETLLNLEAILHRRIVGQNEAIREIAGSLRRARSGVRSEKKPIGSFLFLGPTGVGKTETVRTLAGVYFGSEKRIIRLDMSEYQETHSINRLIGNKDTRDGGALTEAVIAAPFSLILLDELEKAHPNVLDLFLQVLDEGRLTDALGRVINFTNTMIVATSNAGAELIREMVQRGKNPAEANEEIMDYLQKQGIFKPEFLNRFDAVVVYRPLSEEELAQVAILLLEELNARLAQKEVSIKITQQLAVAVARGGYSPEFGARPLARFIQEHIENYVAEGLIAGTIQRGAVVEISPEMLESENPG